MNHREQVCAIVKQYGFKKGVELGLASGQLFGKLLREFPDLHMIGVDRSTHLARRDQVRVIEGAYPSRAVVLEMETSQAHGYIPDASQDFVFIDADHSYQGCLADIRNYLPKVRPGGVLMGHDYNPQAWPGVVRAVHQVFGRDVAVLDDCVWVVKIEGVPNAQG